MDADLKSKLDRNIWITRKCRINASERLLRTAKFIEFLNVYYSIFVIGLSIFSLEPGEKWISVASLISSIALTISIIYANATGLRERSTSLKQNYISLQVLLDRLAFIKSDDEAGIQKIGAEYAELLKTTENHLSVDMYRFKAAATDPQLQLQGKEKIRWWAYLAWSFLWKAMVIILPVAGVGCMWLLKG